MRYSSFAILSSFHCWHFVIHFKSTATWQSRLYSLATFPNPFLRVTSLNVSIKQGWSRKERKNGDQVPEATLNLGPCVRKREIKRRSLSGLSILNVYYSNIIICWLTHSWWSIFIVSRSLCSCLRGAESHPLIGFWLWSSNHVSTM